MPAGGVQANPLAPTATDVESEYDPNVIRRIIEFMRSFQESAYVDYKDVVISGEPDIAGRRPHLVLRSPDGNLWRVEVDNAGALSTTLIPFDPGIRGATADA